MGPTDNPLTSMLDPKATLDDLRGEIDEIDTAIHDLLMRRAAVAERIGEVKDGAAAPAATKRPGSIYLRPGREAAVLRRLIDRHSGPFPLASMVRLWREIMSSLLRLQGPFSVAVYAADGRGAQPSAYWDLARDYFGATTPMIACQSASQVVREVAEGGATVGVLPFPEQGEKSPWWPLLLGASTEEPRICARLPFVEPQSGRAATVSAVAIARVVPEETGDDRSLIAIEIQDEVSRTRLTAALSRAGLTPLFVTTKPGSSDGFYLIEVAGFVVSGDARLARLAEALDGAVCSVLVLGAYASTAAQQAVMPRKAAGRGSRRS